MNTSSEVGRELKVSDLKPRTIVWVFKDGGKAMATMWVMDVSYGTVEFYAGVTHIHFLAKRCGSEREQITDNTGAEMKMFEYLGAP